MTIFTNLRRAVGTAMMLALIAAWIPLLWLSYGLHLVISLPRLLTSAWQDWRFHTRRTPDCGYTLWQSVRFSFRMWWQEVRE